MAGLGIVGSPPTFGDDVAVTDDHDAVHAFDFGVERGDEVLEAGRRDALLLGRASWQWGRECWNGQQGEEKVVTHGRIQAKMRRGVLHKLWTKCSGKFVNSF